MVEIPEHQKEALELKQGYLAALQVLGRYRGIKPEDIEETVMDTAEALAMEAEAVARLLFNILCFVYPHDIGKEACNIIKELAGEQKETEAADTPTG